MTSALDSREKGGDGAGLARVWLKMVVYLICKVI